jgi:threonine synthase
LPRLRESVTRDQLGPRQPSLWRYRELLPHTHNAHVVSLGEGFTPLLSAPRLGAKLGVSRLLIKDEGVNPTGTFKPRGAAVGVARASELGIRTVCLASSGSAATAWSTYGARAGLEVVVVMPTSASRTARDECRITGATVIRVRGSYAECAEVIQAGVREHNWFPVTALAEPYRVEGKKTLGYEIAEQLGWRVPDVIVQPTGGGVGLIALHKAFDELEALGWIGADRPRLVAAQAEGCAPLVRAHARGEDRCEAWTEPATIATNLMVPSPIGARLALRALRQTYGTAVAVTDDQILQAMVTTARSEGLLVGPEGGAAIAAVASLRQQAWIDERDQVVIVNTSTGVRYAPLIQRAASTRWSPSRP